MRRLSALAACAAIAAAACDRRQPPAQRDSQRPSVEPAPAVPSPSWPPPDPLVSFPDMVELLGATAHEGLLRLSSFDGRELLAVVDLESGCISATEDALGGAAAAGSGRVAEFQMPANVDPTTLTEEEHRDLLRRMVDAMPSSEELTRGALAVVAAPAFQQRVLPLLRRFGVREVGALSLDPEGRRILLAADDDKMYRSLDGGATFARLDARPSYAPHVSPDGEMASYRHAAGGGQYRIALLPMRPGARPRLVGRRHPLEHFWAPDSRSLVVVYPDQPDGTACLDRIEVPSGRAHEIACFVSDTGWEGIFGTSSDGHWGWLDTCDPAVSDETRTRFGGCMLRLLDLRTGEMLAQQRARPSPDAHVDDRGLLAWSSGVFPDERAHVTSAHGMVEAGPGRPLGWDGQGRLLVVDPHRIAGYGTSPPPPERALCGLVHAVRVSPP